MPMMSLGLSAAVARSIRQRRVDLGISQETLADLCGLDRTYISSIERGRRNLTLTTLERIIPHLSLTAEKFFALVVANLEARR